jgi:hypothetical protein
LAGDGAARAFVVAGEHDDFDVETFRISIATTLALMLG